MLDSECRERTEMAESERRGVLMGGYAEREAASQRASHGLLDLGRAPSPIVATAAGSPAGQSAGP